MNRLVEQFNNLDVNGICLRSILDRCITNNFFHERTCDGCKLDYAYVLVVCIQKNGNTLRHIYLCDNCAFSLHEESYESIGYRGHGAHLIII